ncbi:MAG: hypothetical protein ABSG03_04385 [Bryobacteraceae bacterium]|jgi:hypothetical protein
MTTIAQLEANLANAQHSTGPKTEKGKHRTRLNAYRHGLTGQICLLTADEHQAFDKHCTGIRESLQPVGALESDLAQSIAEDHWRLKRARALETGIFALGQNGALGAPVTRDRDDPAQLPIDEALSQARTWLAKSDNFQLLALYEQRIHRAIEKNMAQLRTLRAERKAVHQQALEEAQLLARLAYSKGEKYDPARDFPPEILQIGSDFSSAGIRRLVDRNQRLSEARRCAENRGGWPMACQAQGSGTSTAA